VLTLTADRFGIVREVGACGDTFAHHPARIAILVILSMGPMDRTAVSRIGMRIRRRYGGPSLRRGDALGWAAPRLLLWTGPGVIQIAPQPSQAIRLGS
jgi:hypothetical protein